MNSEEKNLNPNSSTDGGLISNTTGEKIQSVFDYGAMIYEKDKNPEYIKLLEDVIEFLKQNPNQKSGQSAEMLKSKFHIAEVPIQRVEDSLWYQFTKDEKLGQSLQGWREDGVGENRKRIPHVAFSADLDYLDGFINRIIKKAKDLNIV